MTQTLFAHINKRKKKRQTKIQEKKNLHPKNLTSSFSNSFISSGKQGGGATVLWEEQDIVTRESCFSECKQFRKSSCAASCLLLSSVAGAGPFSLSLSLSLSPSLLSLLFQAQTSAYPK
jgi:hypothetical protein